MSREHLEKRFGIIAIEKGFVTPSQVLEAMETQLKENMQNNLHRTIGEILVENGNMKRSQVKEVLASMDMPI